MTDRTDSLFLADAIMARNSWAKQMRDVGSSYERAVTSYHTTLKAQESADAAAAQKKAALVMLALTVASGSVLGLVFGKTAGKAVAADLAIDTICKNNMTKTFNALAWADSNVAANFAIGKAWDHLAADAKSKLNKHITAATVAAKLPVGTLGQTVGPVEYLSNLMNMLDDLQSAALLHGRSFIAKGDMAGLETFKKQSPFFQVKPEPVNKDLTAKRIELGFWMKYILNRDYITYYRTMTSSAGMGNSTYTKKMTRPIMEAPSSPDYPGNQSNHAGRANIGYNEIGSIIAKHINELCQGTNMCGGRFMDDSIHIFSNNISGIVIKKAETTLNELSQNNAKAILNKVKTAIPVAPSSGYIGPLHQYPTR